MIQKFLDNITPVFLMALVAMGGYVWDSQGEYVHDQAVMTGRIIALEKDLASNGLLTEDLSRLIYQTITDVNVANNELAHLTKYLTEQASHVQRLREWQCPNKG